MSVNNTNKLIVSVAVAMLLAACGGGGGGGGGGNAAAGAGSGGDQTAQTPPATGSGSASDGSGAPPVDNNPPSEAPPTAVLPPSMPSGSQTPVNAPPPADQLPAGVDMTNPSKPVKASAVTASSSNGGNTPDKSVDGNLTSRWESEQGNDNEWIMYDFGVKTMVNGMQITWENAAAAEFAIELSDDAITFYQARYIVGGTGGTQQFMNLNVNARYIRIRGVKRTTTFGYSIYETTFASPGSDNSLNGGAAKTATAFPFPTDGSKLAAPPPMTAPLETVQFSLPDGTLITRMGFVGRGRHGRERGENWNELGYGVNETVDANGKPQDLGPGNYLSFVENYFQFRTWEVEFIDDSHVSGVTKPTLRINSYYQVGQKAGGYSFWRGIDRPGVTGYGWMTSGQLVNPQLYNNDLDPNSASCPIVPYPPDTALTTPGTGLNNGCSVTLDNYPGHSALSPDANGVLVPNGQNIAARNLMIGDALEFTPSFFATPDTQAAVGMTGGHRYYTTEITYQVGTGVVPQTFIQPRLNNAVLPEDAREAGLVTLSYDVADNPEFNYQQPFNNIGGQNMQRFVEGRRDFHTSMQTGAHTEAGNDVNTSLIGLQGPHYQQPTCFQCHQNNARSLPPVVINQRLDTMAVFTAALDGNGNQVPDPTYGVTMLMNSLPSNSGTMTSWGNGAYVADFQTQNVTLADGTVVTLKKPVIGFEGPAPKIFSLRNAPPVIGVGLLAAIPDADIIASARATPDADGVKGTVAYGYDPDSGNVCVGRFGWKAAKCTLRHQVAGALLTDMSVTSSLFPNRECLFGPQNCNATFRADKGLPEKDLVALTRYVSMLTVPAQRKYTLGFPQNVAPLPYLNPNPTLIAAGQKVFETIKCQSCHKQTQTTGSNTELAEARNQKIWPYTDLLLHDMGTPLADGFVEGQASGTMFKTPALWGIGMLRWVGGYERTNAAPIPMGYLHDGRANTITEAILWHNGEAATAKNRFIQLSTDDRNALLAFIDSL
jgi:CxxC motif-containing protein (DUF1111 family)